MPAYSDHPFRGGAPNVPKYRPPGPVRQAWMRKPVTRGRSPNAQTTRDGRMQSPRGTDDVGEPYDAMTRAELVRLERARLADARAKEARRRESLSEWQREDEDGRFRSETARYRDSVIAVCQIAEAGRALSRSSRHDVDAEDANAPNDGQVRATRDLSDVGSASANKNLPEHSGRRGGINEEERQRAAAERLARGFMAPRLTTPATYAVGGEHDAERGADTRFMSFGAILHAVDVGTVRPLRGSYLSMLWRSGERLRRRQELPDSAFWTADELRECMHACNLGYGCGEPGMSAFGQLLVCLSYKWHTTKAPDDAAGSHLHHVGRMAETYLFSEVTHVFSRFPAGVRTGSRGADFAVLWDYGSIYQPPWRTADEKRQHADAKNASLIWFGHRFTVAWVQPTLGTDAATTDSTYASDGASPATAAFDASAWTFTEGACTSVLKPRQHRLDISRHPPLDERPPKRTDTAAWRRFYLECVLPECASLRRAPPLLPEALARLVRTSGLRCSHTPDLEMLIDSYEDFFVAVTRMTPELTFSCMGWTAAHMPALARFLACCKRCTSLDVSGNDLAHEGGRVLADALAQSTCPVSRVDLRETRVDAETVERLLGIIRLRAIHLSALPIYSTREITRLGVTHGQLQAQPRILIDRRAREQRVRRIQRREERRERAAWDARGAHRLGWESSDEAEQTPRAARVCSAYGTASGLTFNVGGYNGLPNTPTRHIKSPRRDGPPHEVMQLV